MELSPAGGSTGRKKALDGRTWYEGPDQGSQGGAAHFIKYSQSYKIIIAHDHSNAIDGLPFLPWWARCLFFTFQIY